MDGILRYGIDTAARVSSTPRGRMPGFKPVVTPPAAPASVESLGSRLARAEQDARRLRADFMLQAHEAAALGGQVAATDPSPVRDRQTIYAESVQAAQASGLSYDAWMATEDGRKFYAEYRAAPEPES